MAQLIKLAVVLGVVGLGMYVFDSRIVAPWAYGSGATLTRRWVGEFRTPTGRTGVLELDLRHVTVHRRSWGWHGYGLLAGTARSCGLVRGPTYQVEGSSSRSGGDVLLTVQVPMPAAEGLYVHELRGAWAGDSLRVAGVLSYYAGTTHTIHGGARDESQATRFGLHPAAAAEFDRACQQMGGHPPT